MSDPTRQTIIDAAAIQAAAAIIAARLHPISNTAAESVMSLAMQILNEYQKIAEERTQGQIKAFTPSNTSHAD